MSHGREEVLNELDGSSTVDTDKDDAENVALSRRRAFAWLLGAGGVAALAGCVDENGRVSTQGVEEDLSGTVIVWVDTVLGAVAPAARTGDLATKTSANLGNAIIAIAKGCVSGAGKGDGGGGVFYWDSSSSTGDDGGTIIVPSGSSSGRWIRIFDGNIVNAAWFGIASGQDSSVGIRAAVTACQTLGGGTAYIPDGSYTVALKAATTYCVYLPGNVSLRGQSRANTILLMASTSVAGVVNLAGSDYSVENITIDGNKSGTPNASKYGFSFVPPNARIQLRSVTIQNCDGDGITINPTQTNATTDIDIVDCYVHNNASSGISITAGNSQRIATRNCLIVNNGTSGGAFGQWVMEGAAAGGINHYVIEGCCIDEGTAGQNLTALQVAGNNNALVDTVSVKDTQIKGSVYITDVDGLVMEACSVTASNGNACPIKIAQYGMNVTIQACEITLASTSTAASAVWLAGSLGIPLANVNVFDNIINVDTTTSDGVLVQQALSARVERNSIVGNSAMTAGYGIDVYASGIQGGVAFGTCAARNNHIVDFTYGIYVRSAIATATIRDLDVSHNLFESATLTMTAAMSLDSDGNHAALQVSCIGNSSVSAAAMTMFKTYPHVPVLIAGNRGDVSDWVIKNGAAPSFIATTGSTCRRADGGAGTSLYVNESATGSGATWTGK